MGVQLQNVVLQTALLPVQEVTASLNGTGIPVAVLKDDGLIVLMVESVSGAGRTLDVAVEDATTLGGSYAALSPAVAFVQVTTSDAEQAILLYLEGVREFIRIALTVAGTSPIYRVGCGLLATRL